MLVPLLRHGIPASVKTRAVRNGSSTTTSKGFGTSSRRKEEGTVKLAPAVDAGRSEDNVWSHRIYIRNILARLIKNRTRRVLSSNSKEGADTKKEEGENGNLLQDEKVSNRRVFSVPEGVGVLRFPGDVRSNPAPSVESDEAVSYFAFRTLEWQSARNGKAVQKPIQYSRFFDSLGYSLAKTEHIGANSAFLDELVEELSEKETTNYAQQSMTVTQKLATLKQILQAGRSQNLFQFMIRQSEDLEFMKAIPGLTFAEILRQFESGDDFLPLRNDYKELGPKHYWMLSAWRKKVYKTLRDRRQLYHDIFMRRIESGATISISDYTQLLNLARSTWDGALALELLKAMIANKIQPNLSCYKHYFEARCWADAYHPSENHQLRVMPASYEERKSEPKRDVPGDVVVDGHRVEKDGIHWEITRMFTKMVVDEGINADTRAYCNLIIAQSREGQIDAIKVVLKQIWNINVDDILAGTPDHKQQHLQADSPTYPTEELLYTLAHAFGSNNDISTAMQVVAHFSSTYDIAISQAVWTELLEWTFVLSTPRRNGRASQGYTKGQLPLRSVESLFNVMLGAPYYGEPTLRMYDFVLRSLARRPLNHGTLYDFLERMREGALFHVQACEAFAKARHKFGNMLVNKNFTDGLRLESQRAEVEKAWRERWTAFVIVRKWFTLLLTQPRWLRNVEERERIWTRKMLPDAITEFMRYKAHKPFIYPTATGRVELEDVDEERRWAMNQAAKGRGDNFMPEMEDWESIWASVDGAEQYDEELDADADHPGTYDDVEGVSIEYN